MRQQAGLLGVSGISGDMRVLLASDDLRAVEAVDLFCYVARKAVGALAAVLGGIDTLVFTGGVGEHVPAIRARICDGLGFLGIALDEQRDTAHAAVISTTGAPVTVRVIPTNEELVIAGHTHALTR